MCSVSENCLFQGGDGPTGPKGEGGEVGDMVKTDFIFHINISLYHALKSHILR